MRETAESGSVGDWQRFESSGRVEDYLRYSRCGGTWENRNECPEAKASDSDQNHDTGAAEF